MRLKLKFIGTEISSSSEYAHFHGNLELFSNRDNSLKATEIFKATNRRVLLSELLCN
jgi:hypothetical protein